MRPDPRALVVIVGQLANSDCKERALKMMLSRCRLLLWTLSILVFYPLLPASVSAAECQLIRVTGEAGAAGSRVRIEPQEAAISTETCVVWINWVRGSTVRIIFREDAAACRSVTQAPSGFTTKDTFYTTEFLPRGGTSSLTFVDKGRCRYRVEIPDAGRTVMGLPPGQAVAEGHLLIE
jgi:hypothetical protein